MAFARPYANNTSLFHSFEEELKKAYGGFLTVKDLCDYHKCSKNTAKKYMEPFRQYKMPNGSVKCIRTVDYAKYLADEAGI